MKLTEHQESNVHTHRNLPFVNEQSDITRVKPRYNLVPRSHSASMTVGDLGTRLAAAPMDSCGDLFGFISICPYVFFFHFLSSIRLIARLTFGCILIALRIRLPSTRIRRIGRANPQPLESSQPLQSGKFRTRKEYGIVSTIEYSMTSQTQMQCLPRENCYRFSYTESP